MSGSVLLLHASPPPPSLTVLGKRKVTAGARLASPVYVLQAPTQTTVAPYSSATKPSSPVGARSYDVEEDHDSDEETAVAQPSGSTKKARSRSASTSSSRRKSYTCSWEGCDKAYTKPCRLAEHFRSHTNDRPFQCISCDKTFLRKVHLQAHVRSHASTDDRPLVCTAQEGCTQRFWTQQKLRIHEDTHRGERPYKCIEPQCEESFSKAFQLRQHVAAVHCPPGTKPFRCEREGCSQSFLTSQKLKSHMKTHQDDRYACFEESCADTSGPKYFRTWTELQVHLRETHPPTCPHPECSEKTFRDSHTLKLHLRRHDTGEDSDESEVEPESKRRKASDSRSFPCEEEGCGQAFNAVSALRAHHKVKHLGQLDYVCTNSGCDRRFGYKRNLQHHLRSCRPATVPGSSIVDHITGQAFVDKTQTKPRSLPCPFDDNGKECSHVYGRMYDLRRHLKAVHGVEMDNAALEDLYPTTSFS